MAAVTTMARHLLVLKGEDVVFDSRSGTGPRSLFYTFSASKPLIALGVHLLAERGALSLDDPVARHWPAYGQHGKGGITVRQVLTHRAGVSTSARTIVGDLAAMHDWQRSVRLAETARPSSRPGARVAYHSLSFGFILGELIQRVSGQGLLDFLHREFLDPLQLADTYFQLPPERMADRVPLISAGPLEWIRRDLFNSERVRTAMIPATSMCTTAADQARLYRMLLRGGLLQDGTRLLHASTIAAALQVSSDGEFDAGMLHTARWGTGFQLGFPGEVRCFGTRANRDTFGHNGANICNVWADPQRDLVLVYLSNLIQKRLRARRHLSAVSDEAFRRYG